MLTTSYQAFKTLELLRSRCGLSARDSATHLMCISESTYSTLRKSLDAGRECTLSASNDINVRIGLKVLVDGLESKLLPVTAADKEVSIARLSKLRESIRLESCEALSPSGIQQVDQLLSLDQLIGYAKIFMSA